MVQLEDAIALAVEAHRGRWDKGGQPYVLHPLRVMMRFDTLAERLTAVLHDVVEDTDWTLERLRGAGYPEDVLEALDAVTRREGESYDGFIDRLSTNRLARRVKLADLEDNMDVRRLAEVGQREADRLAQYRRSWEKLKRLEAAASGR